MCMKIMVQAHMGRSYACVCYGKREIVFSHVIRDIWLSLGDMHARVY